MVYCVGYIGHPPSFISSMSSFLHPRLFGSLFCFVCHAKITTSLSQHSRNHVPEGSQRTTITSAGEGDSQLVHILGFHRVTRNVLEARPCPIGRWVNFDFWGGGPAWAAKEVATISLSLKTYPFIVRICTAISMVKPTIL